jgi:tRNA(Ile)-lysidine synthase
MDLELPSGGTYVVAVSGGVDSMALLHLLHDADTPYRLVVAHLDHGIRSDSAEDRRLVQATAKQLGLPFVYHEVRLGPRASEAAARQARYEFLHKVSANSNARAIITAHHADDVLETAIINLLRGSGRLGLTSLQNRHDVLRPLRRLTKQEIIDYARQNGLVWREDSTNKDEVYLRNYVRRRIVPRLTKADQKKLHDIIRNLQKTSRELDTLLVKYLHLQSVGGRLDRNEFNHLPHSVAREVMAAWLRAHGLKAIDSKMLERLVVAAKTGKPGQKTDASNGYVLRITARTLALHRAER